MQGSVFQRVEYKSQSHYDGFGIENLTQWDWVGLKFFFFNYSNEQNLILFKNSIFGWLFIKCNLSTFSCERFKLSFSVLPLELKYDQKVQHGHLFFKKLEKKISSILAKTKFERTGIEPTAL